MDKLVIEQAQRAIIQGESVKARRILAGELVTDPRNEQLWLLLSQVVPPEKVKETLERVLKINPNNQEAVEKINALTPGLRLIENAEQGNPDLAQVDNSIESIPAVKNNKEDVTFFATERDQHSLPIAISEEEFDALFKQPSNAAEEKDQKSVNLGVSREAIDEFNKQTGFNQEIPASSLDVTEEELEALFKKSLDGVVEEEQRSVNLGVSRDAKNVSNNLTDMNQPSSTSSLEVTEEELDALFKKIEQRTLKQTAASDADRNVGLNVPGELNQDLELRMNGSNDELDNLLNIGEYPSQTEQNTFTGKKEFKIGLEDIIPQKNSVSILDADPVAKSPDEANLPGENLTDDQFEPLEPIDEVDLSEPDTPAVPRESIMDHEPPPISVESRAQTTPVLLSERLHPPQKKEKVSGAVRSKQKPKGLPKWFLALILTPVAGCILVVAGFSWYYFYGPCGVESVASSTQYLLHTQQRWEDSLILATNSSRVVLTEPLVKLEDIRQELIDTKVPTCMQGAKENFQNSMQATIEAYVSFLQYVGESAIRDKFNVAASEMSEYKRKMQVIQNCAPFCPLIPNSQ